MTHNNFPQILAHRGASHYAPENTKAAILLAAQMGAQWIEVDLHLTRDHNVAIIHNPTVNKCTNGKGNVLDFTTAQLRKLDAGNWFSAEFAGEKVLMLDQLIKLLTRLKMNVNLELKPTPGHEDILAHVTTSTLQQYWPTDKPLPLMSSFSVPALAAIKAAFPQAPRGLLLDQWQKNALQTADKLDCIAINLSRRIVTPKIVKAIKATERKILVYTVNSWRVAKPLFEEGVDGVFTDRPDVMLAKIADF